MQPPIYSICAASTDVGDVLGASADRLYAWGEVPPGVDLPYAVWQVIPGGSPENYLSGRPDIDSFMLQIDVYGITPGSVNEVTRALRDVIEGHAYIVRWGAQDTDPDTGHRHISFDVDWMVHR